MRDLTTAELRTADEVFFCGTGTELTPVVEVEGEAVGSGAIEPVTERLRAVYLEMVRADGTPKWP